MNKKVLRVKKGIEKRLSCAHLDEFDFCHEGNQPMRNTIKCHLICCSCKCWLGKKKA